MVERAGGISRTIFFTCIVFLYLTLFSYSFAGVLVPPKDLMYKHDPDYKIPDPDPEDPSAKKEKPPKIYYYKKDAFKEYYQYSGRYIQSPNTQKSTDTYTQPYQESSQQENYTNLETKNKNYNFLLIILITLLITLGIGYIYLYVSNKQKEINTTPVYEKYSTKIPKRRKRESIFD